MKNFYLILSICLLLATGQLYAQNDTLYVYKGGIVVNKQSIKTADVDSIIFYKPTPILPAGTVTIGTQVWTTQNLDVATYRDGTVIPQVTDPTQWANLKTGAWCYYENNTANGTTYGKLYNWYAVAGIHDTDPSTPNKKLAPAGYHIPTDAEWTTLTTFLGGESVAGNKMKATTGWTPYSGITDTNSSGFTGFPGSLRNYNGTFISGELGNLGYWWSASEYNSSNAWYRSLQFSNAIATKSFEFKESGLSVRCVAGEGAVVAVAPAVTTTTVTAITTTAATTGGNVTNDGGAAVTARGVVYSTTTNPTIALTTKTVDGTGTGTFVSSITGLTANTTYYVRAYATSSAGTSYGNEVSFNTATITNPLVITTAAIPAGTFIMGSPTTESNRWDDETQRSVTLPAFRMSTHEITCAQFAAFCNASNIESNGLWAAGPYPTRVLVYPNSTYGLSYSSGSWTPVTGKANAPMVQVSWFGAAAFAQYAGGRLPTEAEWEYAARATTTTAFNTGACLSNTQANYNWAEPQTGCTNTSTNLPNSTQNVGTYAPNAWGLYDMHGNVWEWCSDWYGDYSNTASTNPTGPTTGSYHVVRGGSWGSGALECRSAERYYDRPTDNNGYYGFRIVF